MHQKCTIAPELKHRKSGYVERKRSPAKISSLDVMNAMLYVVENGCNWRSLPKENREGRQGCETLKSSNN